MTKELSRILQLSVWLLFASFPALAQDKSVNALCRLLPDYTPPPGVEYQPGIGAHGKTVMPATLNPLEAAMPDIINIPITANLAKRFNLDLPQGIRLRPDVGMLSIHRNGQVEYNGQDLSAGARAICVKQSKEDKAVDGQTSANPVPSVENRIEGYYTD